MTIHIAVEILVGKPPAREWMDELGERTLNTFCLNFQDMGIDASNVSIAIFRKDDE